RAGSSHWETFREGFLEACLARPWAGILKRVRTPRLFGQSKVMILVKATPGQRPGLNGVNRPGFHGFIDGLAEAKTQAAIEPDGSIVLGSHFQNRSTQTGPPKAVSFADLAHQIEAAWPMRQARKNRGVDLFVKTVKFDFGVMLDQRFVPGHPEISIRKPRRGGRIIKTDFHPETFEIGETHGVYSSFFTRKQRYAFDEY